MISTTKEAELRARERALITELYSKPKHGIDTTLEALVVTAEMGTQAIETTFLNDREIVLALKKEVTQAPYPNMVRHDLLKFISRRLFLFDHQAEIDSDTVKEIALASATLGHLRGRRHFIP